jgi:hypothetical protein
MTHEEIENGEIVNVRYDQDGGDDSFVVGVRGEVVSVASGLVRVEETDGRHYVVDLENNEVSCRSGRGREKAVCDLVDLSVESVSDHLIRSDDLYDYSEKYTDELNDVTGAIARANAAIGVVHRESDANFVSESDAWKAANVYENGLEQRIEEHNETDYGVSDRQTIVFPNEALAYAWVEEICGQISDGAWENQVGDWQQYYGAYVEVDESLSSVEIDGYLPALNFSAELMEYEGLPGRIMFYLIASGVDEDVTRGEIDDLISMRLQNAFGY